MQQASQVDYTYASSERNIEPIDLTDSFQSTIERRKLKPKDQKIYSNFTTEKKPIETFGPQTEEEYEKISVEVGHLRDVALPEVNANSFGNNKALKDFMSKSHFEYQSSDCPLITPPIEKYRQRVVDKYLAGKTRGGTRTYKSTFGYSSSGGLEVGGGFSNSTSSLLAKPPPPEPILHKTKSKSTTRLTSY